MSENFEPLVEAARDGDERAFRALVEPLGRELHAYAYRLRRDRRGRDLPRSSHLGREIGVDSRTSG